MVGVALSKSRIDKAGRNLAANPAEFDDASLEEHISLEEVFDKYRESHLPPLTGLTSTIQNLLSNTDYEYYIAQRLKRKPQILRKLKRLSVRLTQLQDIGGLRVIVEDNHTVDEVSGLIDTLLDKNPQYELQRTTDYRPFGRDDSGYRAVHKIIRFGGQFLELQLRSRAQHHWAESVERTSVFYGRRIKEGEGDNFVILYFKNLSGAYSELERGQRLTVEAMSTLRTLREQSEQVIRRDGFSHLMDGVVNEDVVKTLIQKETANPGQMNNWILVFDWKTANFVTWDIASRVPEEAVLQYVRYEKGFPEDQKFEVVLIGSSDVSTVQKTHSHYFGIATPDRILDDLGASVQMLSEDLDIDAGAKRILSRLAKRKIWGFGQGMQKQTLQNHFCKDVRDFEGSLNLLLSLGLVLDKSGAGITLDVSRTAEIEKLL